MFAIISAEWALSMGSQEDPLISLPVLARSERCDARGGERQAAHQEQAGLVIARVPVDCGIATWRS